MTNDRIIARLRTPGASPNGPGDGPIGVAYDGAAGALTRIALRNALFSLLTLGVYRFWAKTRLRRYLWASVTLHGDRMEYTGRAGELLRGFLVAFVILSIFGVAVAAAAAFAGENVAVRDAIQFVQGLAFLFLIHFAIFRARRYRLSRSQWRGIRGGQSGSAVRYAFGAIGWLFVVGITFGLAYALYRTRLARYRIENSWFGSQRFAFDAKDGDLFGLWFIAWLFFIPSLGLTYIWYRVREFRHFTARTRLGGLSFRSGLSAGGVIGTVLLYLVSVACVTIGVFLLLTVAFAAASRSGAISGGGDGFAMDWTAAGPEAWTLIVTFLLYMVTIGVLYVLLFVHPLFDRVVSSLEITGEIDFAALTQSRQDMPGRGEGFADALDVGSI
jgi:uncharacterized membrane protein YjgN (DUF898 family)